MVNKLDLYRIFYIVAENKSFSAAAKELFMTQPAISQSILQLENDLEIRLFNRTPKGVSLTTEGSLLLKYIVPAIHLLETGEKKIAELKNLTSGELRIGVGDTISKYLMLPHLETFRTRYPNVKLKIMNGTTDKIVANLKSGQVDMSICNLPIQDQAIHIRPILDVQDTFVYGEKYRKLLEKPIQLHELAKLPLIFLEKKSNSRRYVEEFFLTKGVKLKPEFELGSHDLVVEFAKMNLGIACVTREFTTATLQSGQLKEVHLVEQIPKRSIGICTLKTVPLSPASAKFLEIVEGN